MWSVYSFLVLEDVSPCFGRTVPLRVATENMQRVGIVAVLVVLGCHMIQIVARADACREGDLMPCWSYSTRRGALYNLGTALNKVFLLYARNVAVFQTLALFEYVL